MNNTLLLAGFASYCIMLMELDANVALQPVLLEAEATYHEMLILDGQLSDIYAGMAQPDITLFRCESCGEPDATCGCPWFVNREYSRLLDIASEADQGDEDRFADYNYDPADDICEDCGRFICNCHTQAERDQERYSGGSNELNTAGTGFWDEDGDDSPRPIYVSTGPAEDALWAELKQVQDAEGVYSRKRDDLLTIADRDAWHILHERKIELWRLLDAF